MSTTKFPAAASTAVTPAVAGAPTMQDVILALQGYWAAYGATISQPFNTEVGAGTANPATALRVLGPEPWKVAYVEPSVRPDDARYGENPNRLQTHTQFQVIIKPEPGDPQEVYLASLEAIGIDLHRHDVRFVEDNWASPALGAWGLGWEVWLDGMEITQFTYFQQAGGCRCSRSRSRSPTGSSVSSWRSRASTTSQIAPAEFRARLAKLTFEDKLGSVGQRADRIGVIARTVARVTGLVDDTAKVVDRTAELAKFDLATQMVIELPSLAGVMAREYALRAAEQPAVADALAEMEQPRTAEDVLPASPAGAVMSLADRLAQLDCLAGTAAFSALVAAVQRVVRIVPVGTVATVDDAHLLPPAEQQLAAAHRQVVAVLAIALQPDLEHYVAAAEPLPSAINRFSTTCW